MSDSQQNSSENDDPREDPQLPSKYENKIVENSKKAPTIIVFAGHGHSGKSCILHAQTKQLVAPGQLRRSSDTERPSRHDEFRIDIPDLIDHIDKPRSILDRDDDGEWFADEWRQTGRNG